MMRIAEGYMDIGPETIKNLKNDHHDDSVGFNRDIIQYWMIKNRDNQIQVIIQITQRLQ